MPNFDFLQKIWGKGSPPHFVNSFQENRFLCCILLTDQIFCLIAFTFLRYWTICVFKLFVSQVMSSIILKITLSF